MKRAYLCLLASLSAAPALAQQQPASHDSVRVAVHFGSDNEEFNQLMSHVLHIEKLHVEASSPRAAGKRFHLTYQEYRQGVPGPEQELVGAAARLTSFDQAGQFRADIFARQVAETRLETKFIFTSGSTVKRFEALPGHGDQYSLRSDIWPYRPRPAAAVTPGQQPTKERSFPIGQKVPFLVYTLPYEKDGWLLYCQLAQSEVPVNEWFAKFKIPHFIVYNLTIE